MRAQSLYLKNIEISSFAEHWGLCKTENIGLNTLNYGLFFCLGQWVI